VIGYNSVGAGSDAGYTVTWQTGGGGGGGGGGGNGGFCSQFSKVETFTMTWGDTTTRYKTADLGGFGQGTVVVGQFTVPSSPSSYANAGSDAWAEYGAPPTYRILTLSSSPCDFRNPDPTGVNGPLAGAAGTAPLINFNVGGSASSGSTDTTYALVPGQTYYFSIQNLNCPTGVSCDASTTVSQWPH